MESFLKIFEWYYAGANKTREIRYNHQEVVFNRCKIKVSMPL